MKQYRTIEITLEIEEDSTEAIQDIVEDIENDVDTLLSRYVPQNGKIHYFSTCIHDFDDDEDEDGLEER